MPASILVVDEYNTKLSILFTALLTIIAGYQLSPPQNKTVIFQ